MKEKKIVIIITKKRRSKRKEKYRNKTKKEKFISQLKAKTTTYKPLKHFQCSKYNGEMEETHRQWQKERKKEIERKN